MKSVSTLDRFLDFSHIFRRLVCYISLPPFPYHTYDLLRYSNQYTSKLSEKLAMLELPPQLECQDPHCNIQEDVQARDSLLPDILIAMIETSHETIPLGGCNRTKWAPDKHCEIETAIPKICARISCTGMVSGFPLGGSTKVNSTL